MAAIEDMSPEALAAEVRYWREDSAATLNMGVVRDKLAKNDNRPWSWRRPRLLLMQEVADRLRKALTGDIALDACDACGKAVTVGQKVFSCADGGSLHADCMGMPTTTEGFVGPDDEPLPADAPIPEPFVYSALYTQEQFEHAVAEAGAWFSEQGLRT